MSRSVAIGTRNAIVCKLDRSDIFALADPNILHSMGYTYDTSPSGVICQIDPVSGCQRGKCKEKKIEKDKLDITDPWHFGKW